MRDFPSIPVVKAMCFQWRGSGSIPGQRTNIPHAVQCDQGWGEDRKNPNS